MPTYLYECKECGNPQELTHKMKDSPEIICKECGCKNHEKIIQPTPFILKGSGFHKNDYPV